MTLQTNPELECAFDIVRHTNKSLYLTGKAGSGKTTFLRKIREEGLKQMVVVAPTGVAAINAGGMTIHSFFQLPFGIHLPNVQRKSEQPFQRISRKKSRLMRSLDLLVIDEISMVRADLLDAIDQTLRRQRHSERPFGGVQLLMIGDLHQLPPVTTDEDWELLQPHYETPYFFGSLALQRTDYCSIELKHIYRQSDSEFINLLNKVRDNRLDQSALEILNSRYRDNFRPPAEQGYITLTATNAVAAQINTQNLNALQKQSHFFEASVDGDFSPNAYPTEEKLEFKVGAQVMFIKNDMDAEKRFFNGKIGRITGFRDDAIMVRCPDDSEEIGVSRAEWQNIRYSLNEETKEVEEKVLGTFTQYPLKLAWAITIHKSQGLTFDRAIIDAQAAFAHGQVYVALSRCRSFEGIVLRSLIEQSSVKTDPVVTQFSKDVENTTPDQQQIAQARRDRQHELVIELFSFSDVIASVQRLLRVYVEHQSTLTTQATEQVRGLSQCVSSELAEVARRFKPQLDEYLQANDLPEANQPLQERIRKASVYFVEKLTRLFEQSKTLAVESENQAVRKQVVEQIENLREKLHVKIACFGSCKSGFVAHDYQRAKITAPLELGTQASKSRGPVSVPKDTPHPELFKQLLQFRQQTADENELVPHEIFPVATIRELVERLPTGKELLDIRGIGKARWKNYGAAVSQIIQQFCDENKLETNQQPSQKSLAESSDTKAISFTMFQSGNTIEQIASQRKLKPTTIEGHLAHFITLGQLELSKLVDSESTSLMEAYFSKSPNATMSEAKNHLGAKISYGQLRMYIAHMKRRRDG